VHGVSVRGGDRRAVDGPAESGDGARQARHGAARGAGDGAERLRGAFARREAKRHNAFDGHQGGAATGRSGQGQVGSGVCSSEELSNRNFISFLSINNIYLFIYFFHSAFN
jgi:hypothetical protein